MIEIRSDDLEMGPFSTWADTEATRATAVKTVQVKVDHKAATRQAIIVALRRVGFKFDTRSDWKARPGETSDGPDWDYHGIALHHAGNSFSCDADGSAQIRKAERIDMKNFGHTNSHYAVARDGTIYEALYIRYEGAHIGSGNTGVIGIVMLADFSARGEAYNEEYADKSLLGKIKVVSDWVPDRIDTTTDEPAKEKLKALFSLVKILCIFFPVVMLGGHRE